MTLTFMIEPVAKGRPRISSRGGLIRAFTPKKTRSFEAEVAAIAKAQRPPLLTGALAVEIRIFLTPPKRLTRVFPTVKPDLDNFVKGICDALNGIAWTDDKNIVFLTVGKHYGKQSYFTVSVAEIEAEGA